MNKNKFLILLGVGIVGLVLVFLVVRGLFGGAGSQNGTNTQNIPDYVLNSAEEVQVKEFVQNFISLYNTYTTEDTSNLAALGDYQTETMQNNTALRIKSLEAGPEGLSVVTESDGNTFAYTYTEANRLSVTMKARETQINTDKGTNIQKQTQYEVQLVRENGRWLVRSIQTF